MRVIKLGGAAIEGEAEVQILASALLAIEEQVALVHGGGRMVDALQRRLGLRATKIAGMRRTDEATLPAVLMALCGTVSSRLVAALIAGGVDAVGLSGVDGGLFRCRPLTIPEGDLGLVGEIVQVRTDLLRSLLAQGIVPVVAPVSLGMDGQIYNVNADQAASALAHGLCARQLDLVSDVPGVLSGDRALSTLSASETERMMRTGEIGGGMIPKVAAALAALERGVSSVRIVDLAGLSGAGGTTFSADGMARSHASSGQGARP